MVVRLRGFVKEKIRTKLHDGIPLGDKGCLTQSEISKLNYFYGLAIRRNANNLETMKRAM
jgi:hypothetical protein